MTVEGKGFFIWQVLRTEGGNPAAIVAKAQAAGLTHVLLKMADIQYEFGFHPQTKEDLVAPVVAALKAAKIQAWGWHYVKGDDPLGEAEVAVRRTRDLELDGYVIDAEIEYKQAGKDKAAEAYMQALRKGLPDTPIALSSFRYPSYHKTLPWAAFLERSDYNMPQVYWEQAHNPAQQLRRVIREFSDLNLVGHLRPLIPTGSAYGTSGWRATPGDLVEFFNEAQALGLQAANLYSWDWATSANNTDLWDAAVGFSWPTSFARMAERPPNTGAAPPPATPISDFKKPGMAGLSPTPIGEFAALVAQFSEALNNHDLDALIGLYAKTAVHVNGRRVVVGQKAIRQWYQRLFSEFLPGAAFNLHQVQRREYLLLVHWNVNSTLGPFVNGRDWLAVRDGQIYHHSTNFFA